MKKFLEAFAKELIYGGHWSSLAAPSIVFVSSVVLRLPLTWDCLLATYFGVHATRMYNRYKEFEKDLATNPERSKHIRKYLRYLPILIVLFSTVALGLPLLFGRIWGILIGIFMIFFGFLYSKFFKGKIKVVAFKDFYVAFWWSLLPIFATLYYAQPITFASILFAVFVFLRLFINISFFDIKDVQVDRKENVITLPVAFGVKKTISVLWILSIFSLLPIALGIALQLFDVKSLTFFMILPYTYYYLKRGLRTGIKEDVFLYYIVVDGEQIFVWPLLLLPYFQ